METTTVGSAPISADVMDWLKIAIGGDVIEGMSYTLLHKESGQLLTYVNVWTRVRQNSLGLFYFGRV